MRVFAAPGKKAPRIKYSGSKYSGPKVVNNVGGNGKNFLSDILGTVVNTVTLPIRMVGSLFKGKGLSGGRRLRRGFKVLKGRTGYRGRTTGTHKKRFSKKTKGKSWWVRAHRRKGHIRGGGD